MKVTALNGPAPERVRRFPGVEVLFFLVLGCAAAALFTRMTAYWKWKRDEPTGQLGLLSWALGFGALIPFLLLVVVAPNPELTEHASRRARRGQILMFVAMAIMFLTEAFLLTY
jgi:hypothetical protein